MKTILNKIVLITFLFFFGAGWYYIGSKDHIVKIISSEQNNGYWQNVSSTNAIVKTATSSQNISQGPAPKTAVS